MRDSSGPGSSPNERPGAGRGAAVDALARLSRIGGDELRCDLAVLYLDQGAERLRACRLAISRGDLAALAEAAHSLKSGSAQLGAGALAEACEAVEAAAEHDDVAAARDWYGVVEARYAAFSAWLAEQTGAGRLAGRTRAADASATHPPDAGRRPRVAVVEDNADNRLLVDAILGDRFTLDEFATGADALAGMLVRRPDLVLLDVSLPGMDGLEVLMRMRRAPDLRAVPVVALTAHAMAGDRERYLAAGFDEYVAKPIVDEHAVVAVIERLLSRGRSVTSESDGNRSDS